MAYASLDDWLDEIENLATRRQRLLEHFDLSTVLPWLGTAWRLGMAAQCVLDADRIERLENLLTKADLSLAVMQLVPADDDVSRDLRTLRREIAAALRQGSAG